MQRCKNLRTIADCLIFIAEKITKCILLLTSLRIY